jgi:predicted nucleotidyltransferase
MDKREAVERDRRYSELVIKKYNPKKIILFGTYAKGTYRNGSDIDIAIIFEKVEGSFLESLTSYGEVLFQRN